MKKNRRACHRRVCQWVIVIDGPSGSGKSTVGQRLASKIGYLYLDTGALYRCVALAAFQQGIKPVTDASVTGASVTGSPENSKKLYELAKRCKISFKRRTSKKFGFEQHVFLNGRNVTKKIRSPKISLLASAYASLPVVRRALLCQQRSLGAQGGMVAEGRDLGTVVFPKAQLKFFLIASHRERAKRRYLELLKSCQTRLSKAHSLKTVEREMQARDRADARRALAPLKKAKDAIQIDTTSLTIDQVVQEMYKNFREKWRENLNQ